MPTDTDGAYDPKAGLLFDKNNILLDPYAKAVTGQSKWGKHMGEDPALSCEGSQN